MNRATRQGFTLLELLAVILVIGFLMALLVPVLGMARQASEATQCLSRMRTSGAAVLRYFAERNGAFFPTKYWEVYPSWGKSGKQGMRDYLGIETSLETINDNADFMFDTSITCPTLRRLYPEVRMALHRTMVYNYYLNEKDPSSNYNSLPSTQRPMLPNGYHKLQSLERPEATWMLVDGSKSETGATFYDTSITEKSIARICAQHKAHAHFIFMDGHVERLKREEIEARNADRFFWGRRETP